MSLEKYDQQNIKDNTTVILYMLGPDGNMVKFMLKKYMKLAKMMDLYCTKKGLDIKSLRFLCEGTPVNGDLTAAEVRKEGDVIEAFNKTDGGFIS